MAFSYIDTGDRPVFDIAEPNLAYRDPDGEVAYLIQDGVVLGGGGGSGGGGSSGGYRIGFIGESLVEHNHSANVQRKLSTWSRGMLNWANALNPGLCVFDVWYDPKSYPGWEPGAPGSTVYFRGANAGVGGQTSKQILDRKEFLVKNVDVDLVVISTGTNSMSGDSVADIIKWRDETVDYYLKAGKTVILLPVLLRNIDSWTVASGYREKCSYVNATAQDMVKSRKNCYLFDWNTYWVDFNHPQGNALPGFTPDGIHFNTMSGYVLGKAFGEFLKTILPYTPTYNVIAPNDLYHAEKNPFGNKHSNPMLTGTTGTISAPVTGVCATGFRIIRSTSFGCAVEGAKEVRADGRGNYQVINFTPSGAAGSELSTFSTASTDVRHDLPVGSWVRASIEVEANKWDGWQGITMHLRDNAAAGLQVNGMESYNNDQWPTDGWKGLITTPAFQIVDAASALRWQVQIRVDNSKTTKGVLKIGAPELRVVEDPRKIVNYRGE